MKRMVVLVLIACGISSYGQTLKESDVPNAVKEALKQRFPDSKGVKWSKESEDEFEAEFKTRGVEQSVNFNESGEWIVTETEIEEHEIPQNLRVTIAKEFEGYKVQEAEKGERPDGLFYGMILKKDKKVIEVEISSTGEILLKADKS